MFSFFGPKPELGIVFHIGSSSIGAGLIRLHHGEKPHVLYTLRQAIPYREKVKPERFFDDMIETLKQVNLRLAKEGLSHLKFTEFGSLKIKRVFYAFSSPWSVTQTKIATMEKPEGFIFSKEIVDTIVSDNEKDFEKKVLEGTGLSDALQIVEQKVIQIKLNGYELLNPYGKKAYRADLSLFMSLVPKAVIDKVFDISMTTYHPKNTEVFSLPLASFSTIRDVFHDTKDFIFIDIGGELSDISIIKDGLIIETASFPFGRNFLVRKIAEKFATTAELAVSLIKMYHEGHVEAAVSDKLKPVIAEASMEWSGAFHKTLEAIALKVSLPKNLFAVINNDFVSFFMKALKDERITEFGLQETPLSVVLVHHDKLKSVVSFGKHAEHDPFVAILSAFAGRMYESKTK